MVYVSGEWPPDQGCPTRPSWEDPKHCHNTLLRCHASGGAGEQIDRPAMTRAPTDLLHADLQFLASGRPGLPEMGGAVCRVPILS